MFLRSQPKKRMEVWHCGEPHGKSRFFSVAKNPYGVSMFHMDFPWFFFQRFPTIFSHLGLSENVVYPIVPTGFADHYPYEKWLFHWED